MTLKHILELSGRVQNMPPALSCPVCESIFKELPENRSCADAHIDAHWCTCLAYSTIDRKDTYAKKAVKFVVNYINTELEAKARMPNSTKPLCAHLRLKSIISAKKSEITRVNATYSYLSYLLVFDVSPSNAKFETTVLYYPELKNNNTIEITGSISRLNEYSTQSACVTTDYLRKYCFCLKQPSKKKTGWLNF
jgi:hypothetical protein